MEHDGRTHRARRKVHGPGVPRGERKVRDGRHDDGIERRRPALHGGQDAHLAHRGGRGGGPGGRRGDGMTRFLTASALLALALCPAAAAQDAAPLAADAATNLYIVSNAEIRRGWRRDQVMEDGTNLVDRSGVVAAKADGAAIETVSNGAAEIADAAKAAMEAAVAGLASVTGQIPARAQHALLCVRPDLAARPALTFVLTNAAVSADGRTLSFVAAANRLLGSRPSMTLAFGDGVDEEETAKVKWTGEWDAASASHAGSVEIPARYRGRPACLFENVALGDAGGLFDFGSLVVAVGTKTAWNGVVTNALDGSEVKVENGFFKKANVNGGVQ
nr:MAG TPA: hypothetical protein [Caudoviricetes sp.]